MKMAKGELVMCLDADSQLDQYALSHVARYFTDPNVVALSANVKILPEDDFLNIIQQIEYIICYQMKRAHTMFNIEYIIGGIGSTFRKKYLEKINYYDTNTVTEDIDLTMKILHSGDKHTKVMYGADVVAYTQAVLTVGDLVKQRFRWKWGRYQTFLKHISMFFSKDEKYDKKLTWIYLPYTIYSDIAFFFEPLLVLFILFIVLYYHDLFTLLSSLIIVTLYKSMNILAEETLSMKKKLSYLIITPSMYFLFYLLSYVEYTALVRSWINMHTLSQSIKKNEYTWEHVGRKKIAANIALS
jgi:cellulose synthase/poly-beta-1,6-N-acetylglucosamine synthase-like glycosyltransferase